MSCSDPATISAAEAEPLVDQYDNRQAVGDVAWRRMEALRVFLDAATCRYDLTFFKKRVRDQHRLIQQSARVVGVVEVEDEAGQFIAKIGLTFDGFVQTWFRLLAETGDAHVTVITFGATCTERMRILSRASWTSKLFVSRVRPLRRIKSLLIGPRIFSTRLSVSPCTCSPSSG